VYPCVPNELHAKHLIPAERHSCRFGWRCRAVPATGRGSPTPSESAQLLARH
jgi:hypothetical protein